MLSDNHMHTKFSGDSEADPHKMIEAAMYRGLKGITFTDHLDLDYPTQPGYFDLDIDSYLKELTPLKEDFANDNFDVRIGIELGLQTHLAMQHKSILSAYDFDFVIGSIHQVNGADPYYDEFFEGISFKDAYGSYFETVLENLRAFSDIDTLGHLDYIVRYGRRVAATRKESGNMHLSDHEKVIDAIYDFLIANDIALEVNTGAFRSGLDEPNPSYMLLRHYYSKGGRRITLGADAHSPEHVGIGFGEVIPMLKKIGFEGYYVFSNRKGEFCSF